MTRKSRRRNEATPPAADLPATGYSDAARQAIQETTARVHEMHRAIAGKSFDTLAHIPLVAGPAAFVRQMHDAIAGGIYAAIHHGTGAVLGTAAMIERQLPAERDAGPPSRAASSLRSALNAAFGDHLSALGNVLAIDMGIYADGRPLPLEREALDRAFPDSGKRLAVFIHGLAFDEHCWHPTGPDEVDLGRTLQAEFGYTPLYLRYNSGLPIVDNGSRLALLLEALVSAWPEQVGELLLVGHSMGGLIARQACELAAGSELYWPRVTRMLVCLGSPHLGAPVARLGHAASAALDMSEVTAPLAKIAGARSQGIKDLRFGPANTAAGAPGIAFRFVGSTLTDDVAHPLAEWLGDGLVTLGSATGHPLVGDVKSARLGGIAHMALLTAPRVLEEIKAWRRELDHE